MRNMKINKYDILAIILIAMVILVAAILYFQTHGKNIEFPEKLGDMNISLYTQGDTAIREIKELHGNNSRRIENAYIVEYKSNSGSKAKFWISESANNDEAVSLATAMSKMVGTSGMFSNSTPMNIEGITVYFVSGHMEHMGLYHYFYSKDNRVFWIEVDNHDESYRADFVRESIERI